MNIILYNLEWMIYNILLALIAVILALLMFKFENKIVKILLGIIWLVFIPNTIYMLTDIIHLPKQLMIQKAPLIQLVLIFQYSLLLTTSVFTFILALYPFEKMTMSLIKEPLQMRKNITYFMIFILNFLIALGVGLGRFQRINSWEIFTNTEYVITQTARLLKSSELLGIILFGFLSNIIYFLFKKIIIKLLPKNYY